MEPAAPALLPAPRAELGGCIWLPRILAKAKMIQCGELPPAYAARFCDANSIDEHFLQAFALTRAELLEAVARYPTQSEQIAWFQARPQGDPAAIARWNKLAVNLGRPGYPLEARLAQVLPTTYRHLDPERVHSLFDLLEADENQV